MVVTTVRLIVGRTFIDSRLSCVSYLQPSRSEQRSIDGRLHDNWQLGSACLPAGGSIGFHFLAIVQTCACKVKWRILLPEFDRKLQTNHPLWAVGTHEIQVFASLTSWRLASTFELVLPPDTMRHSSLSAGTSTKRKKTAEIPLALESSFLATVLGWFDILHVRKGAKFRLNRCDAMLRTFVVTSDPMRIFKYSTWRNFKKTKYYWKQVSEVCSCDWTWSRSNKQTNMSFITL